MSEESEIILVEEDVRKYIEESAEKRQQAKEAYMELYKYEWVRLAPNQALIKVCQVCMTTIMRGYGVGNHICKYCFDSGFLSPVQFMESPNNKDNRCNSCGSTSRTAIIMTSCCLKIVCMTCYVDDVEEPESICSACDSYMAFHHWAVDWYYSRKVLKPGFTCLYGTMTRRALSARVKNDEVIASEHARWNGYQWLIDRHERNRIKIEEESAKIDRYPLKWCLRDLNSLDNPNKCILFI